MITFKIEEMKQEKRKFRLTIRVNRRIEEVKYFKNLDELKPCLIKKINLLEIR